MHPLTVFLQDLPHRLPQWIVDCARVVASEAAVGWVVIVIGVALIVLAGWFFLGHRQKTAAIKRLMNEVKKTEGEPGFRASVDEIGDALKKAGKGDAIEQVRQAWQEYHETLVIPNNEDDETASVRNTVRPNFFFNAYDLGFRNNGWRQIPGIFVSVGLLLTFLGIIAAIASLKTFDDAAMRNFLDAAKSKFIMSLTGLAASIVFRLVYIPVIIEDA